MQLYPWPQPGFFLNGGLGLSLLHTGAMPGGDSITDDGATLTLGAGLEVPQGASPCKRGRPTRATRAASRASAETSARSAEAERP